MSVLFVATSALFAVYLSLQAMEDAKSKTVYVWANNAMVVLMSFLYVGKCFALQSAPDMVGVVVSYQFLLLHKVLWNKMFGKGDAKAYCAMFLQSGLFWKASAGFLLLVPLFSAFLANLFFVLFRFTKGVLEKKTAKETFAGKKREAFFPFLLFGYLLSTCGFVIFLRVAFG